MTIPLTKEMLEQLIQTTEYIKLKEMYNKTDDEMYEWVCQASHFVVEIEESDLDQELKDKLIYNYSYDWS